MKNGTFVYGKASDSYSRRQRPKNAVEGENFTDRVKENKEIEVRL